MNDFEKAQRNLKNDMMVLFLLELIAFIISICMKNINIFFLVYAALNFLGYSLAKLGSKMASTIGFIIGVLMIITIINGSMGSIINFLLGIFVVIHSLKYNKSIQ